MRYCKSDVFLPSRRSQLNGNSRTPSRSRCWPTRAVNRTPIRLSSGDTSALMVDSEPLVFQSLVQIPEGALPPISHVPPFRAISLHWNLPCCSARHFKGNEQDG